MTGCSSNSIRTIALLGIIIRCARQSDYSTFCFLFRWLILPRPRSSCVRVARTKLGQEVSLVQLYVAVYPCRLSFIQRITLVLLSRSSVSSPTHRRSGGSHAPLSYESRDGRVPLPIVSQRFQPAHLLLLHSPSELLSPMEHASPHERSGGASIEVTEPVD